MVRVDSLCLCKYCSLLSQEAHHNHAPFLVQPFIFPGVNHCFLFLFTLLFTFTLLFFFPNALTSCHTFPLMGSICSSISVLSFSWRPVSQLALFLFQSRLLFRPVQSHHPRTSDLLSSVLDAVF